MFCFDSKSPSLDTQYLIRYTQYCRKNVSQRVGMACLQRNLGNRSNLLHHPCLSRKYPGKATHSQEKEVVNVISPPPSLCCLLYSANDFSVPVFLLRIMLNLCSPPAHANECFFYP